MDGKKEDSILVALLLTLTGGFLDAYTFMLRGGTFANAQTGNIRASTLPKAMQAMR